MPELKPEFLPAEQLDAIRAQFPVLSQQVNDQPLLYLDNAATTQKPLCVLNTLDAWYRETNANVHRASHALSSRATEQFEQARQTVREFINAPHCEEVIWTRGATEAINLVAQSLGRAEGFTLERGEFSLQPGDEIIVSEMSHHANIVPWQQLAAERGLVLRWIPVKADGSIDLDQYMRLLSPKTRLVAVGHVSNALGTIHQVRHICALAQLSGALTLIDGAQAVGHFAVDVQALGCDFYCFSGHKVFGPTGIGVLWGRREVLEAMPAWQGGGEMIRTVTREGFTPAPLPFKFEAGTPAAAQAAGLAAALKFLQQQDRAALERHELALLQRAEAGLKQIPGVRVLAESCPRVSVLSFTLDSAHPQDLGMLLDLQGIAVRVGHHCAQPLMQALGLPGTARASFAFYNTPQEVDRFVAAVAEVREYL